ncbi:MAG TPA: hypothetical protein VFW06_07965 [Acidimicrobiia bacterium]|nr:hypothetical protein [Acidimicrobiia bacterium]
MVEVLLAAALLLGGSWSSFRAFSFLRRGKRFEAVVTHVEDHGIWASYGGRRYTLELRMSTEDGDREVTVDTTWRASVFSRAPAIGDVVPVVVSPDGETVEMRFDLLFSDLVGSIFLAVAGVVVLVLLVS